MREGERERERERGRDREMNMGQTYDVHKTFDGGRETAKEGSEKRMSVLWRPQIIQVGLYSHYQS